MKDITGWWKIKAAQVPNEDFELEWKNIEDIDDPKTRSTRFVFGEDGTFRQLIAIPEGVSQADIDAAVAAGEAEILEGLIVMQKTAWKEENGKLWVDTGVRGTGSDDQPLDPWTELTETEDGICYQSAFVAYNLIKA